MELQSLALERFNVSTTEDDSLKKLVEQTGNFSPSDHGDVVLQFFKDHSSAEGVVVLEAEKPAGLIMRNDFFQKLGSLYGRDLFMHRPIQLIMNEDPLIVDVSVNISSISLIAMNRDQQRLYDLVVVTEEENYIGVVSIKRFMVELSRQREKEIDLLKRQKEILRMANDAEIRHRVQIETVNDALREKNDSIKNLFDNAGQGFLSFGSDLTISEEYSLECVEIFRGPIGGKDFVELIARHVSDETAQTISSVMQSVFSFAKAFQQKVYLSLLPEEITIYKKVVRFEYKLILHLGQKRMMLILTDITEKKNLELKMAEERLNLKMVVKAVSRQYDVNSAIRELRQFISEDAALLIRTSEDPSVALAELFRSIHTFKGDFAQLSLHSTAGNLHEIEDQLALLNGREQAVSLEDLVDILNQMDPRAILRKDLAVISDTLGKSFFDSEESFSIEKDKLIELEGRVGLALRGPEQEEIVNLIRSMRLHDFRDLLKPYTDYLLSLSASLEKSVRPMVITGDDILIDRQSYSGFMKALYHLFRNIVDHGIETVEERTEAEKDQSGNVECNITRYGDDKLRLVISDDGRGIDLEKVCTRAVEKGLVAAEKVNTMKAEEICELIFLDSFSTKDNITALSGRGVGLAALRAETENLGGMVFVDSNPGQGSRFTFIMPVIAD